jgi:hypothetical protein
MRLGQPERGPLKLCMALSTIGGLLWTVSKRDGHDSSLLIMDIHISRSRRQAISGQYPGVSRSVIDEN